MTTKARDNVLDLTSPPISAITMSGVGAGIDMAGTALTNVASTMTVIGSFTVNNGAQDLATFESDGTLIASKNITVPFDSGQINARFGGDAANNDIEVGSTNGFVHKVVLHNLNTDPVNAPAGAFPMDLEVNRIVASDTRAKSFGDPSVVSGSEPSGWSINAGPSTPKKIINVATPTAFFDAANKGYVDTAIIPSGTRMVFYQASAPVGWTQLAGVNDRVLRFVDGGGGGAGGSWTITGLTVQPHALNALQIPFHSHGYQDTVWSENLFSNPCGAPLGIVGGNNWMGSGDSDDCDNNLFYRNTSTSGLGGNQAHPHGITHNASWRPAYINVIAAFKN